LAEAKLDKKSNFPKPGLTNLNDFLEQGVCVFELTCCDDPAPAAE
tara:strand:- start:65 stop:199 length:135 start_codon:yes stop_codon:yes gene_type:complete